MTDIQSRIVASGPPNIYCGIMGQIGDIVIYTAVLRRIKEMWPASRVTFAVSERYREAGELVAGLPGVDRLFVAGSYFERLSGDRMALWEAGWPVDARGDDEVAEERRNDLVFETRPRHENAAWWETGHIAAEMARGCGVPGLTDLRTEIAIPPDTRIPEGWRGRVVVHNDPGIDPRKAWPWERVRELASLISPARLALLGGPGPPVPGALDLRGRTTLAEAAAVIEASACYVGIDSGLMWIAGSLSAPAVGIYGTEYVPARSAVFPANPNAVYLHAEGSTAAITADNVAAAIDAAMKNGNRRATLATEGRRDERGP